MRNPRDFGKPLAIGAPAPVWEIPFKPSRMIHFLDFSNEKMVAKVPEIAPMVDILLGNLEDAVPADRKVAARDGLVRVGKEMELGDTQLWTRVNSLESPWVLDDLTTLVAEIGDRLDVVMVPKVEGPWDIHYVDRLLAQLEAKAGLERPILVHALLETGLGVVNVEAIAAASPRMQGMSFGPADLAASRRMKTTRVGGGHPGYRVLGDPDPDAPDAPRPSAQQDLWHYSIARMVDACTSAGILPFYGPFGDIRDLEGCETQFRSAFLLGCVGAWSLHPAQIEIAKRVFSPDPDEVAFAKRVLEAIPDGRGVHMLDGKMQDDATWKQAQVMVSLAGCSPTRTRSYAPSTASERRRLAAGASRRLKRNTGGHMRISAKADYAVRAMVELAAAADEKPVKAERIATAQGIPLNFLENILGELRHAGLVRSHRGAEGGFRLAKDASKISVADVIRAVGGPSRASAAPRPRSRSTTVPPRRSRASGSPCARTCARSSSTSRSPTSPAASSPARSIGSPTIRTSGSRADRSVADAGTRA